MIQFLHIFRKDMRRHWPEILISLAVLALFTHHELRLWQAPPEYNSFSSFFFIVSGRYIPFFLALSWIFLILRVVHGETLVGDRQWWVTKPYVWWQLLLSKLFFVFVFIWVPLFHVQLFLLHHADFSILTNLGRLFLMQLTLSLVLIVFAFALASLTKNLAQALLGVGIVVVVLIVGLWLDSLSSHMMGVSSVFLDDLKMLLTLGSIVVVPVWQFARRRTWVSRVAVAASFSACMLFSFVPLGSRVEQSYPLFATTDAPAQLTILPIPESQEKSSDLPGFPSATFLTIPIRASGVAPGSVVLIDGLKITADSSEGFQWTRGWASQYSQVWPESQFENLSYEVKPKEYEKIKTKPVNLHIQLALSEYQEVETRTLVLPDGIFRDSELGICRLTGVGYTFLDCRKPFISPAYMGRFDAFNSRCKTVLNDPPTKLDLYYGWSGPRAESLPDPGLNPVVEHFVSFNRVHRMHDPNDSSPVYSVATLCPGAEISLGRPVFKRRFRIQLELPGVRLENLERVSFRTVSGVSIDLRRPML